MPAFDEIMLFYSNSEFEIEILIKEGSTVYIEDSKILLVNLTSVSITTYNDTASPAGYVNLYTMDQPVDKISSKAAFHLIKDVTVDFATLTSGHGFTDYELTKIGIGGTTFDVTRTSISLENIIARRIAASRSTGIFLYLTYLQTKTLTLSKISDFIYRKC